MGNIGVVRGLWSGEVGITAVILPSYEEAVQYVEHAFDMYPNLLGRKKVEGTHAFFEVIERNLREKTGKIASVTSSYDGKTREYEEQVASPFFDNFFTEYYGGCGECYGIVVDEVKFGTPFNAFDFD